MTHIDPGGPVFISHRHSDGRTLAWQQARALRASGVPVWLDHDDLPPGDSTERLAEALDHGLSGGILVLTPEVTDSVAVVDVEAPRLFALTKDPAFTFAIINEILEEDGSIDRHAPSQITNLDPDIDSILQYSTHDPYRPLPAVARGFAKSRLRQMRVGREGSPLVIDMQTRRAASAYASTADLVFRAVPPSTGARVPADDVWEDLDAMLAWLPDVLAASRAAEVVFSGGGHLTVAFTIGAALPSSSGIRLAALDAKGELWRRPIASGPPPRAQPLGSEPLPVPQPGGSGVAIAVDLHPAPPPVDSFAAHMAGDPGRYVAAYRIERRAWLNAGDGPEAVAQATEEIRRLAAKHQDLNVHLFLRMPWVAALLLGASLNTLLLTLYEWDNSGAGVPAYVMTRTVASGLGGGPVIHQLPKGDTE